MSNSTVGEINVRSGRSTAAGAAGIVGAIWKDDIFGDKIPDQQGEIGQINNSPTINICLSRATWPKPTPLEIADQRRQIDQIGIFQNAVIDISGATDAAAGITDSVPIGILLIRIVYTGTIVAIIPPAVIVFVGRAARGFQNGVGT